MKYLAIIFIVFICSCSYLQGQTVSNEISIDKEIYENNIKSLISPSLLEKIEIIAVDKFPKPSNCNGPSPSATIYYPLHTVGELNDFIPYSGQFSKYSISGLQNGLILRSHSADYNENNTEVKFGNYKSSYLSNIFTKGYLDLNGLFETCTTCVIGGYDKCSNSNFFNYEKRGRIFRDFLLSTKQAKIMNSVENICYDPIVSDGSRPISKTYSNLSNVTFFRFWFKVKPLKSGNTTELNLYSNFKLVGNRSTSNDIFSIRILKKPYILNGTTVNFPYIDQVSGLTKNNCFSDEYFTLSYAPPTVSPTQPDPEKYFKPYPKDTKRKVRNQFILTPEFSDFTVSDFGFSNQSKLFTYEYKLDYPIINSSGEVASEYIYSIIVGVADCGDKPFDDISGLLVQLSDEPIVESLDPCGNEGYLGYTPPCCNTAFSPTPGKKYVVQGWCKLTNESSTAPLQKVKFSLNFGSLTKSDELQSELGKFEDLPFKSLNEWVRFEIPFTMPSDATMFDFEMSLPEVGSGYKAYLDDLRIIPIDSEVKSYVYDSESGKLKSELDSQNYAVHFTYDETGRLVRTSKETSKGVKTINIKIEDE